jgi:phospho-N-acetylmuramoyl-pentapeptide-transferase
MLLLLIERWFAQATAWSELSGIAKITPRASIAAVAGFLLVLAFGPRWIAWLKVRFREPIKSASADIARLHQAKQFTPTMGGIFIVASLLSATLLCGDLGNPYLWIAIALCLALAALGACDDLIKLATTRRGLRARTKLIAQTAISLAAVTAIYALHRQVDRGLELTVPIAGLHYELGWLFIPLGTLVLVGSSNAVNLADGLDGLAGGCLICATGAVALVVYAAGNSQWAAYLNIPHIAGAGEMVVIAAAMSGALLGFLWFNCHPASVFMGDTGSLPLGGLLGLLAVIARQELLLIAIGGVFVVEALSVIVQVGSYRWRKRRVLLCAPLHHHLQLKGWPEDKIVVRFWIAAALCAIVGLAGLKLHATDNAEHETAAMSRVKAMESELAKILDDSPN